MRHVDLPAQQHPDQKVEEIRIAHARAIGALQKDLNERASVVLTNVELPDATDVTLGHKLGRLPKFIAASCVRGASTGGAVIEISRDPKIIVVRAIGFGATVRAEIEVR